MKDGIVSPVQVDPVGAQCTYVNTIGIPYNVSKHTISRSKRRSLVSREAMKPNINGGDDWDPSIIGKVLTSKEEWYDLNSLYACYDTMDKHNSDSVRVKMFAHYGDDDIVRAVNRAGTEGFNEHSVSITTEVMDTLVMLHHEQRELLMTAARITSCYCESLILYVRLTMNRWSSNARCLRAALTRSQGTRGVAERQ